MLQKTMQFCLEVLTSPNADPRQKDGALHMVRYQSECVRYFNFFYVAIYTTLFFIIYFCTCV